MSDLQISTIENFIARILDFDNLKLNEQTDLFIFLLQDELKIESVNAEQIRKVFDKVHLKPLSSLPSYLANNCRSKKSGYPKFINAQNGIKLHRTYRKELSDRVGIKVSLLPSNEIFPIELLDNTRGYLKKVGEQAVVAYDVGIYDASSVMLRKLFEILIIELFERFKIETKIKNSNGDYFYLSDLIITLLAENGNKWNLSRNTRNALPKVKRIGDLSAHSRMFVSKKSDIDNIIYEIRIVIEELIHLIDYQNWSK